MPDILYQACLMLCVKDNNLRQRLNLEITTRTQKQDDLPWLETIEIARSYATDEKDFKSVNKKESDQQSDKRKPWNKNRNGRVGQSKSEGETALAVKPPAGSESSSAQEESIC